MNVRSWQRPCCQTCRHTAGADARCRQFPARVVATLQRPARASRVQPQSGRWDRRPTISRSTVASLLATGLNAKSVDDLAFDKMAVDDLVNVVCIDVRVPNAFGINDNTRTFLAPIKAPGLVDSDLSGALQIERLNARFCVLLHLLCIMVGATRRTVFALVQTEENVTLVIAHVQIIKRRTKRGASQSWVTVH